VGARRAEEQRRRRSGTRRRAAVRGGGAGARTSAAGAVVAMRGLRRAEAGDARVRAVAEVRRPVQAAAGAAVRRCGAAEVRRGRDRARTQTRPDPRDSNGSGRFD
jgi:hypothetical protein